ncbi:MAG: type IV pilus assembly protein PilM [Desulfarculaceae bacterium]|nr:type IV pilus assembly protein PilM [Desulfarculaceae bacterium]
MFKKKDHLVGLDIGSSLIKAAELKKTGKGLVLKKFGITRTPPDSISEGRVTDADSLAAAIQGLFKTNRIKEKNVAIATGGYSVVIKTISVSKEHEENLQNYIFSEAEQYIPYDISDVNIDYQVLGESEFSSEQLNVLLVAVKKDLVAEYIDLTRKAGLNPVIIEVDTFAFQNIFEANTAEETEDISLLVDVGVTKTSLNVLKGTRSLMMRDNSSGTSQIIEEIMAEADCTKEDAENILAGIDRESIPADRLGEITEEVTANWCAGIFDVVNTYRTNINEGDIRRVYLTGGGSLVEGFADMLSADLETEVTTFNPFEKVAMDSKQVQTSATEQSAPLAAIALGLALREMDDK